MALTTGINIARIKVKTLFKYNQNLKLQKTKYLASKEPIRRGEKDVFKTVYLNNCVNCVKCVKMF